MTKYILKHRNRDVAFFAMDEDGDLYSLEIASPEYMPILGNGPKNLAEWIQNRAIPEGRPDLSRILLETGCKTALEYLLQNLALSPSDSYWICPESLKGITWEEISLYQHPDGARIPFFTSRGPTYRTIQNDSALTGSLEKYNVYRQGSWHLVKNGAPGIAFRLQNINEAFASVIHERLGFAEYTKYTLCFDEHGTCESCSCRYFTDESHELVSAYYVTGGICGQAKTPQEAYQEYIDTCIANGLDHNYVVHFMDYMILTDFLITNTDRHWENFGILRDPDTLRFLTLAPIFDSGTSMLYDDPFSKTKHHLMNIGVHGLCHSQAENLCLVRDKKAVDVSRLPDERKTAEFYMACGVPVERATQIARCFELKKDMLLEFQNSDTDWFSTQNTTSQIFL